MADKIIRKGATHRFTLRYEQPVAKYVPITGIISAAPSRITATDHQMPDGWRFAVSGIKGGGSAINSKHAPPKNSDHFKGRVIDADTIEINSVNGAAWPAYVSGGILQYNLPVDLSGCSAKLQVRETVDSPTVLMELTDADHIYVDPLIGTVVVTFPADLTSAITVDKAVFDIELTFLDGSVLYYPTTGIKFTGEVTR